MPYIDQTSRDSLDTNIELLAKKILTSGEMNYVITKLLLSYLGQRTKCYANYNEVIGVLECAKLEFYRRQIADYERVKMIENGDVFSPSYPSVPATPT